MFKYAGKLFILVATLLFGLLLGMQQAERGIHSIEGGTDAPTESLYVKKIDQEHVEVAVLGESFTTKDLEAKKEEWKERNHHNTFSHLGNKIGDAVYSVSKKGAEWFVKQMDKML